jgi:hypothetical protein
MFPPNRAHGRHGSRTHQFKFGAQLDSTEHSFGNAIQIFKKEVVVEQSFGAHESRRLYMIWHPQENSKQQTTHRQNVAAKI